MRNTTSLGKNSLWVLISRLGSQGLAVLFTILLARQLGGKGFGEYAFIAAAIYLGNALTTFGTDMHLIREIASRDDLSGLPAALLIQLGLSVLFIGMVVIGAPLFPNQDPETLQGLQIYSLSLIPLAFFSVFTTALRGKQRMGDYMALNLLVAMAQIAAVWLAVQLNGNIVLVVELLLIAQFTAALFAGLLCTITIPGFWHPWNFSFRNTSTLIRACAPIAFITLLGMLYQKLSIVMLSAIGGAFVTGLFSAALRTVEASKTFHLAVFTAIYPALAQESSYGPEHSRETSWNGLFDRSWWLLLAGAGIAALGLFVLAEPLARNLFGAQFAPSVQAIKILAWVLIPFTINTFFSLVLLAARKERTIVQVQLLGLATLAALNVWWIPQWGLAGACLACLLAESVQAAAYLYPRKYFLHMVDKLFGAA